MTRVAILTPHITSGAAVSSDALGMCAALERHGYDARVYAESSDLQEPKISPLSELKDFLRERSPISYGRSRFLMRLAAAIPPQKRAGLTSDQGELLLSIGKARREVLFGGQWISVDGREFDLKDLVGLSRVKTRRLIQKAKDEKRIAGVEPT